MTDEFETDALDDEFLSSNDGQFLAWAHGLYEYELDIQAVERTERSIDAAYYDGDQHTENEKLEYEDRNQKARVFNEIKPTVDWILGGERRARTDWQVSPRTADDVESAIVKTKLAKYIDDINKAKWHRSLAFEDMVKTGEGWTRVTYEPNADGDYQVTLTHDHWRSMLTANVARKVDMSDMPYLWCSKVVDLNSVVQYFPDKKSELINQAEDKQDLVDDQLEEGMLTQDHNGLTRLTAVRSGVFSLNSQGSTTRQAVRVWEFWYKQTETVELLKGEGPFNNEVFDKDNEEHQQLIANQLYQLRENTREQMYCAMYTASSLLYRQISPYKHNRFPFVRRVAYIKDKTGTAYGVIRQIRDPQSDLNARRNRALYLMATSRVIMTEGAVEDERVLQEEVARHDSIIKVKQGKELRIEDGGQLAPQHIAMSQEDSAYIRQISGVTGENRGMDTNATSGIAIQARQEQGTVITTVLADMQSLARQMEGELVLSLVEQFMDRQMQFRITADNTSEHEFVVINDPHEPETNITRTQADFIVNERDYRTTMRQALSEQMISAAGAIAQHSGNPNLAITLLEMAIDLQDLPNKEQLTAKLREAAGLPPHNETDEQKQAREQAGQQQQAAEQQARENAMREQMAKASEMEARATKTLAETQLMKLREATEKLAAVKVALETGHLANQLGGTGALEAADGIIAEANEILNLEPAPQTQQNPVMEQTNV